MEDQLLSLLYNQQEGTQGQEILKAIVAGNQTGTQLLDQLSSGPSLKPESLDPMVKVLESTMKHIVLWQMLPKHTIKNTVHEYNQLVRYGEDVGIFIPEGATPEGSDTSYRRKSVLTKYMGLLGELTHQAMLVANADGKDPYTREVESKTIQLLTKINEELSSSDSAFSTQRFDGIFKQHFDGVNEANNGSTLDSYFNDTVVIDARGKALSDELVEDGAHAVVNDRFGEVSDIIAPPIVFNDYVKRFHDVKRFNVGSPGAIVGATTGQSVNTIQTQFGNINIKNDIFFDRRTPKDFGQVAVGNNAPNAPVPDATTPIAVVTDTSTKFGDGAGSYFYAVTAKNRTGESALTPLHTSAQVVTATQAVNLLFAASNSGNAATSFTIFRTEKDVANRATAKYYPIFEVSTAQLAAGYDGAAALTIRDRNRFLPNAHSAIMLNPNNQIWEYIQLSGTQKIEFAITTLSKRFAVVNYGTPVLYQPGKIVRIVNIGRDLS